MKMKMNVKQSVFAVMLCMLLVGAIGKPVGVRAAQEPVEGGDGTPITWSVTYSDGKGGSVFPDQSQLVKDGDKTPIYVPEEGVYPGYEFDGWEPELQQRVDADCTYIAQWKPSEQSLGSDDVTSDSGSDMDTNADDLGTDSDIDSDTISQDENEKAAKENAKKNQTNYEDDGSDATDQGLVDDTGSGKENAYADDVDSGDMDASVMIGGVVICGILLAAMIVLLKRQHRD